MKNKITDSNVAPIIPQHPAAKLSRRAFCSACLLAPLGVIQTRQPSPSGVDELSIVADSISRLAASQPKLSGVRSLLAIDQKRIGQGFTTADLEILTGALYLEAQRKLQSVPVKGSSGQDTNRTIRRLITPDDVKTVLSKPIDTSAYGHDYFARVLAEAKAKLAADPQYHVQLATAQAAAKHKTCLGGTPRWICIGMIGVVVIAILLIILL
jgi:hypothetical protein